MITRLFTAADPASAAACGKLLREGELVAFPTETVYGLGGSVWNEKAVAEIFRVKGRPADNPLIAHIAKVGDLGQVVRDVPRAAEALFRAFSPGPLTVVLPKTARVPDIVTAGGGTVAVRIPSHPAARAIIEAAGVPVVAPSANLSGRPSPTDFETTKRDLDGKVAAILDGGACSVGVESTVVLPEGDTRVRILRPGAITPEMLKRIVPEVVVDDNCLRPLTDGAPVLSPGMKHRHYAPRAPLTIVTGAREKVLAFLREKAKDKTTGILCFEGELTGENVVCYGRESDAASQSRALFRALRAFDDMPVARIYARAPSEDGMGLAVANRLLRAAEFTVLEVDGS